MRGTVRELGSETPLVGVLVSARRAGITVTTDRAGRFVLRLAAPDTLLVAAIGYHPETVSVRGDEASPVAVKLNRAPTPLSDIIVAAPPGADPDLAALGQWVSPREAIRSVPAAIEPDVFRALTLVPAVTFSTPLSARPIIRGYDAGASALRIDGFEVVNLYHIARAFSAFPAEATQRIRVATAPQGADLGGTLDGIVDITGRTADTTLLRGGAEVSLASLTGWAGRRSEETSWFAAGRAATLPVTNLAVPGAVLPYAFGDLYGKVRAGTGEVSAFLSRDHLGARSDGSGADWHSLLLGVRWPLVSRGGALFEAVVSGTHFGLDVQGLQTGTILADVRNRFGRVAAGLTGSYRLARARLEVGATMGYRSIANRIVDAADAPGANADFVTRRFEPSGYARVSQSLGGLTLEGGARVDAAGSLGLVQPRFRAEAGVGAGLSIGAAVGRTARMYQLVSDPLSEPDLDFVEYWLDAARRDVPVPKIDHLDAEVTLTRGAATARVSLFASRGTGIAELQPETAVQDSARFRFGRSRTLGAEVQVGFRGTARRERSLSISYVLSSSRRDFGGGWIPWRLDRRHVVRVLGQSALTRRWSFAGSVEAASGLPVTPAEQVIYLERPERAGRGVAFLLGKENSARGGPTFRADVAARYAFQGPGRSRMALGLSVTNIAFGPVAPIVLEGGRGPKVSYKRLFDLPAIPTATLRIEF